MKQLSLYENSKELIRWLKFDLKKQIKKNTKEELILNIGNNDKLVIIDFEFNLMNIIKELDKKNYKDDKIEINYKINFCNTTFNKGADFSNSIFNDKVIFKSTQFLSQITDNTDKSQNIKNIIFDNIIFNKKVDFSEAIFNGVEVNFSNSIFNDEVIFKSTQFLSQITDNTDKSQNIKNIIFDNIIFNKKVDFSEAIFNDVEVNFSNSIFKYKFYFKSSILKSKNYNLKFNNLRFKELVDFSYSEFDIHVYFSECQFNLLEFNKTEFTDININNSSFQNAIKLNQIKIYNSIIFNNTEFNNEVNFTKIIFSNEKSLLKITRDNDNKDKYDKISFISLINTYMEGKVNIEKINIEKIDLEGTDIMGEFSIDYSDSVQLANWETARILKHEEYKKSNSIKALKYHAEETKLYKEYLLEEIKKKFNIKKFGDIFSIYLSSLYSDNGLNWIKSFLCTILFATFFFTLSYNFFILIFIYIFISYAYTLFYNKDIGKYIFISMVSYILISLLYINTDIIGYTKELFSFITPTNFSQILYDKGDLSYIYNSKNIWEIIFKGIFYFLGKIAFWYGSVQTVQSFRKFSKKE